MRRLLIIEDDARIAATLQKELEIAGYDVTLAVSGEEGYCLLAEQSFDLAILDLMLPGRNGLQILSNMRRMGQGVPVIILTAKGEVEDRVAGLDAGASDYMTKPFALPELLARIRTALRQGVVELPAVYTCSDLSVDRLARQVQRNGQVLALTAREFDLLEYLLRFKDQVVSRDMLARDIWKETLRITPLDNVIDVHIGRLRKKVDDDSPLKLIHTVRGVGFMIKEPPS